MVKPIFLALCGVLFSALALAETPRKKPVVYLSFDDGPSSDSVTEDILEVLARHNAKATFFVTGIGARAYPEKIRAIMDAGHAIGNHTLSHQDLTRLKSHQVKNELSVTSQFIREAGGPVAICFRPPFGATNQRVNRVAGSLGLAKIAWSIDTQDWNNVISSDLVAIQMEDVRNKSVVLLHDGPRYRYRTLEVLTNWMNEFGDIYSFEVIPDCKAPDYVDQPPMLAMESTQEPETFEELVHHTIEPLAMSMPEILTKIRNYKITLQPEVTFTTTVVTSQ